MGSSRTPGRLRARPLSSSLCAASRLWFDNGGDDIFSSCFAHIDVHRRRSAIAVARITMIRCLPHGRFCQLRVPASRTTLHARRHPCYTHSRHYTPPRLRPSPHAAALSLPLPHGTASPLTHAATRCHRHAATLVVIATRGRSLAAIATRRHMAASGAMLHAHGLLIARVFLSTRRSFVAPCRPPSTAAGGTLANPGLTSIAGRSGRSA